jgi:hypothetical protein
MGSQRHFFFFLITHMSCTTSYSNEDPEDIVDRELESVTGTVGTGKDTETSKKKRSRDTAAGATSKKRTSGGGGGGGGAGSGGGDETGDGAAPASRRKQTGSSKAAKASAPSGKTRRALAGGTAATGGLRALGLTEFRVGFREEGAVVVAHAPRGCGMSSLLASLALDLQAQCGATGIIVLTDRPESGYMSGVPPPGTLFYNKPPAKVLEALIKYQAEQMNHVAPSSRGGGPPGARSKGVGEDSASSSGEEDGRSGGGAGVGAGSGAAVGDLQKLVLVLDDVLYVPTLLSKAAFQRDLKRADSLGITVLIGTSNARTLSKDVASVATHVFGTRCFAGVDYKTLHQTMFTTLDGPAEVTAVLGATLAGREFLVFHTKVVRPDFTPGLPGCLSYSPTLADRGVFGMNSSLIGSLDCLLTGL